ncbi:hypothetical protein SLEP1_g52366 [Rubroshorea leprosula]|uniref:Uncharacterized protein n=1 Tax=Rubroshorea leprosula TaxID=152421 RepID=A0AAV5M731_9ROSI|nr:hypothetical protein SLEP1_g52366 [Rubroshorea leprosula]
MSEMYIARAAEILSVPKTREICEQAIESSLPDKDIHALMVIFGISGMSLRFSMEMKIPSEKCCEPKEVFSASYSQTHFVLPEYMMQKDQSLTLDDAKDKLKHAGVPEVEMAALERQLAPVSKKVNSKDSSRKVGFVSAGVESQTDGGMTPVATEDIDLPEESDSEDEERVCNCTKLHRKMFHLLYLEVLSGRETMVTEMGMRILYQPKIGKVRAV